MVPPAEQLRWPNYSAKAGKPAQANSLAFSPLRQIFSSVPTSHLDQFGNLDDSLSACTTSANSGFINPIGVTVIWIR